LNRARRKLAVATWTRPTEGLILGRLTVPAGPIEAFAAARGIDVIDVVIAAGGRARARAEGLNGRLVVGRFVPHRGADLAVRAPEAGGMRTRLLRGVDRLSPAGVAEARTSAPSVDLPAWILALPAFVARPLLALLGFVTGGLGRSALGVPAHPHGGAMLTVVQGAHLDEAWAPPPPFAAPSVHVLVLPVREEPVAIDGQVVVRRQLTLCATVDHRFLDGFEGGALATLLRELLADPERMG
jgi:hypothetical protein